MSSTRRADPDSKPRQERFMSSVEFENGLMANLVARRCSVLKSPKERELIYWLQYHSHQEGGLKMLSDNLIARFRERVLTREMAEMGYSERKNYSPEQALKIQMQIPDSAYCYIYQPEDITTFRNPEEDWGIELARPPRPPRREIPRDVPKFYPAKEFKEFCESQAKANLESWLEELCLNPAISLDYGPWYFPELIGSLAEYRAEQTSFLRKNSVLTELGKSVEETLEYSLHGKCLTLIDGRARTGKSFSARKWVELNCDRARFVEIPPGNSDIGFFRAIALALGVSINLNSKAHELRDRIECVLRTGDLMLVFDEAQFAWPDSLNREALPFRVSWIMTLVNAGVPISLIVTNQFFHAQKRTERRSGWTSEQFVGRIAFYQPLPEALSDADLSRVAKSLLPEACADSIKLLVLNAKVSEKYLASIDFTVKRARYLAHKSGRDKVLIGDLKRAITEGVIPSDKALAQVMAKPEKQSSRRKHLVAAPELPQRDDPPMPADRHTPRAVAPISNRETSLVIH